MSSFTFANNFSTTLSAAATASDTTLTVTATTNFPSSISSNKYVPVVLLDAATKSVYEVCYASSISGSNITVVRAQENTTAQAWNIGDYIYCAPTADSVAPKGDYAFNGLDGSNLVAQTANVTLTVDDSGLVQDFSGITAAATATLPATMTAGNNFCVLSNSAYQVTVDPNGHTFLFSDGTTSTSNYNLSLTDGLMVLFFYDGTNVIVVDISRLAKINGDSSEVFNVADATTSTEAVALGQFVTSLNSTGYITLPGGLIFQWGSISSLVSGTSKSGTLPLTFPNAALGGMSSGLGAETNGPIKFVSVTTTTVTLYNAGSLSESGAYYVYGY